MIFLSKNIFIYFFCTAIAVLTFFAFCGDNVKEKNNSPIESKNESKLIITSKIVKQTTIDIQPFEGLSTELSEYIYKELQKVHPKVNLLKPISIPKRSYYAPRNRFRADTIIAILSNQTFNEHVTIGLTNKDISTDNGKYIDWGVMGLGFQPGKACVVSTFRLSKTNIKVQLFKVAIHELGHTQGLPHCPNKLCLMTDAEGKNNTDNEIGFCVKCRAFLNAKGWLL